MESAINVVHDAHSARDLCGRLDADERFVLKPKVPDGRLPLRVDGVLRLNQSTVLLTHLAEQHGVIGGSPRWR